MDGTTADPDHLPYLVAAVDLAHDAVLSLDSAGRITSWNRAAARLFGLSDDLLHLAQVGDLVAHSDRHLWDSGFARAMAGEPLEQLQLSFHHRSGVVVPTRTSASRVHLGGERVGLAVVVHDLTEQTLAQATLAESAERVAESEALAHVGSWVWDTAAAAVQWSAELYCIHGAGPRDFDGTLTDHLGRIHPSDRGGVEGALSDAVQRGSRFEQEFRIVRTDGSVRWIYARATVVAGSTGRPIGLRGIYQDITERHETARVLQEANEGLTQIALYDRLTGLPNRALLMDRLRTSLSGSAGRESRVDVLYLDVDDFKTINDSRGHRAGDEVLVALAARLHEAVRPAAAEGLASRWTLARLHADEFVLVLEDWPEPLAVTERIQSLLKSPLNLPAAEVFVSVSIGSATTRTGIRAGSPEDLLAAANVAMHEAKRAGKARHLAFQPRMHEAARDRQELGDELHRAISRGDFELVYQPVVTLDDSAVIGAEALVRWRHPTRGIVLPDDFIGRAEETGLIVPLGAWVLHEACRQAVELTADTAAEFTIAVNVSGRQLRDGSFLDTVRESLEATGLEPQRLCLEMTESILMERDDDAIAMLTKLRDDGVHLAIDDFGTGYSSLGALRRLPVDLLKIDRSFVASLPGDDDAGTIAWAVVRLGHTLGLPVLAEGVETAAQQEALRGFACDQAQGYLFGRPMPAAQFGQQLLLQRSSAPTRP